MTTIAARFSTREIAADSMCSGESVHYHVTKLKVGARSVFGGAGEWDALLKFYALLEAPGGAVDEDCEVEVLELREDGIWVYESTFIPARIKNDFYAIGTGAHYAIAAMHLGLTPREAVGIAAMYDPCTGGPIDELFLDEALKEAAKVAKAAKKVNKKHKSGLKSEKSVVKSTKTALKVPKSPLKSPKVPLK